MSTYVRLDTASTVCVLFGVSTIVIPGHRTNQPGLRVFGYKRLIFESIWRWKTVDYESTPWWAGNRQLWSSRCASVECCSWNDALKILLWTQFIRHAKADHCIMYAWKNKINSAQNSYSKRESHTSKARSARTQTLSPNGNCRGQLVSFRASIYDFVHNTSSSTLQRSIISPCRT